MTMIGNTILAYRVRRELYRLFKRNVEFKREDGIFKLSFMEHTTKTRASSIATRAELMVKDIWPGSVMVERIARQPIPRLNNALIDWDIVVTLNSQETRKVA